MALPHNKKRTFRLLDGPLLDPEDRRADVIRRMAQDLQLLDATGSESEALITLRLLGYSALDVIMLAEAARRSCLRCTVH